MYPQLVVGYRPTFLFKNIYQVKNMKSVEESTERAPVIVAPVLIFYATTPDIFVNEKNHNFFFHNKNSHN